MSAIIALVISAFGCKFYNIDFCTLFTFISVANTLYESWKNYTNDEATKR